MPKNINIRFVFILLLVVAVFILPPLFYKAGALLLTLAIILYIRNQRVSLLELSAKHEKDIRDIVISENESRRLLRTLIDAHKQDTRKFSKLSDDVSRMRVDLSRQRIDKRALVRKRDGKASAANNAHRSETGQRDQRQRQSSV